MQLQRLGIEVRKVGNLNNLYNDVDLVLKNYSIPPKTTSGVVQANAVAHSLQKMLQSDNYFSVSTIQHCASLCQIFISYERMQLYQTQHCMQWNEMTEDFRQQLVAMVLDDFRGVLNPTK